MNNGAQSTMNKPQDDVIVNDNQPSINLKKPSTQKLKRYERRSDNPFYSWIEVEVVPDNFDTKTQKLHFKCLTCSKLVAVGKRLSNISPYCKRKHPLIPIDKPYKQF